MTAFSCTNKNFKLVYNLCLTNIIGELSWPKVADSAINSGGLYFTLLYCVHRY